jgi:hypothetical protein
VTITSDQISPPIDKPDVDQRPGSSDVGWAERAFHREHKDSAKEPSRVPRARGGRLRILVTTLAISF